MVGWNSFGKILRSLGVTFLAILFFFTCLYDLDCMRNICYHLPSHTLLEQIHGVCVCAGLPRLGFNNPLIPIEGNVVPFSSLVCRDSTVEAGVWKSGEDFPHRGRTVQDKGTVRSQNGQCTDSCSSPFIDGWLCLIWLGSVSLCCLVVEFIVSLLSLSHASTVVCWLIVADDCMCSFLSSVSEMTLETVKTRIALYCVRCQQTLNLSLFC